MRCAFHVVIIPGVLAKLEFRFAMLQSDFWSNRNQRRELWTVALIFIGRKDYCRDELAVRGPTFKFCGLEDLHLRET
jgi:hypothetical protein